MARNRSLYLLLAGVVTAAIVVSLVDFFRSTFFLVLLLFLLAGLVCLVIALPEVVWKAKRVWSGVFGLEKRLEMARDRSKVSPLLEGAIHRSDATACRSTIEFTIGEAHGLGVPLYTCCEALISLRRTHADALRRGLPRELARALDAQITAVSANLSTSADRIALFARNDAWSDRIAVRVEHERHRLDDLTESMRSCQAGLVELMLVGMDGPGLDLLGRRLGALGEAAQELSDAVA